MWPLRRNCYLFLPLTVAIALHGGRETAAQSKQPKAAGGKAVVDASAPRDFRSQRFMIHADLSDAEAKDLIARLEKMYDLIGAYWGKRLQPGQVVEMYVVKDLKNWPAAAIAAEGLQSIRSGGGVTITQSLSSTGPQGQRVHVGARTVCFAVADRGTPQHEAVHAFCGLAFGTTGPNWYSEGMAEMGCYWRDKDSSVQLDPTVLEYLQNNSIKSLNAIVNNQERTGDSWQNYAWRWALCHLLANNPNYAAKFRPLGLELLTERNNSFEKTYGDMAAEISFEYKQFIATIDNGYRVDLTAIDWRKKFSPLGSGTASSTIAANRGWQPTQAVVLPEKTYQYTATGKWSLEKKGETISADGNDQKLGQLVAAVLSQNEAGDYELSSPFPLAASGEFSPPIKGKLFVRCREGWGKLADNTGSVAFKVRLKD